MARRAGEKSGQLKHPEAKDYAETAYSVEVGMEESR